MARHGRGWNVLIGIACACVNAAMQRLAQLAAIEFSATPARPVINADTLGFYLGNLASDRLMIADRLMSFVRSLDVLMFFFVVFIARVILKPQWRNDCVSSLLASDSLVAIRRGGPKRLPVRD